jgi:IclR family acetate operon transcriptional repressor
MTVPAASRTLDLIEAFSETRRPMTISALAKHLGLPPSSCHGLVKTLEERGYLMEHKALGGYYFTKRLEKHALRIGGFEPLPAWVLPALSAMRDQSDETVLLAKLSGASAVYVEVLESAQSVRYMAGVGDARPLYASAAGKALLGALPAEERRALVRQLKLVKRNERTIGTQKELLHDIDTSLERGWFMTRGEYLSDVCALAVPLRLGGDDYAVVLAGPLARVEARLQQHVKLITAFPRAGQ